MINNINKYYDNSKENIQQYMDIDKYLEYKLTFTTTDDNYIVNVLDGNKQLMKCHYEVLGSYNIIDSLWMWSYCTYVEKNLTKMSRRSKKFYKNEKLKNNSDELYLFYTGNSSFFLSHKNISDFLKFALYVTKGQWILSHKYENGIIEFVLVKDVIQSKN
jgi:hypothetical protein